jgi:hypothetical protein
MYEGLRRLSEDEVPNSNGLLVLSEKRFTKVTP